MTFLALIGTTLSIHFLAWLMPGPLFFLIIRNSLIYSRRSGVYTAIGIAVGNFVHISYIILGLTFLLNSFSSLMVLIQYLGATYIAYLGFKTLQIKKKIQDQSEIAQSKQMDLGFVEAAKIGFLTNILSPKASLFFAGIFGSIYAIHPPYWVIVFLWVAMPLNSFLMASLLSYFFTQETVRHFYLKYESYINLLLGITLLIFAGLILFS